MQATARSGRVARNMGVADAVWRDGKPFQTGLRDAWARAILPGEDRRRGRPVTQLPPHAVGLGGHALVAPRRVLGLELNGEIRREGAGKALAAHGALRQNPPCAFTR